MPLDLVVVTPEGEAYSESVEQVVLPGSEGDFGVLESHEKLLAPLKAGAMEIKLPGGRTEWAAVSDGFAEVIGTKVVVLVDECLKGPDIDIERAKATQIETAQAIQQLDDGLEQSEQRTRLERASKLAAVQVDVYTRHHG